MVPYILDGSSVTLGLGQHWPESCCALTLQLYYLPATLGKDRSSTTHEAHSLPCRQTAPGGMFIMDYERKAILGSGFSLTLIMQNKKHTHFPIGSFWSSNGTFNDSRHCAALLSCSVNMDVLLFLPANCHGHLINRITAAPGVKN